jgi:hypothetical protein
MDTEDLDRYKTYTVFVSFMALDQEDAEKFVLDMKPKDWLYHLEIAEEE